MTQFTQNIKMIMIFGLIFGMMVMASTNSSATFDSSSDNDTADDKITNDVEDKSMINNQYVEEDEMPLNDQMSLLSRQFKLLNEKRQEEYRMLEKSLHSFVEKHLQEYINIDVKKELKDLRAEIKILHQGVSPKREKLTEWLSSSIAELRSEISELQASASNLTKSCHQRNLFTEEIREIRDDMNTFRLELSAIKSRQSKSEALLHELREELTQSSEDLTRHRSVKSYDHEYKTHADQKKRHYRLLRDMVHEVELKQRSIGKRLSDFEGQKLFDRVHNLEMSQQRLASSNFNLSRQVSEVDKLRASLLELLEDIEDVESKLDKTVPEIRREISKVEIDSAQLSSDQNILKEEGHNMAKTIQALAVSVSTLQNEQSSNRNLESEINMLQMEVEMLKTDKTSSSSLPMKTLNEKMEKYTRDSASSSASDGAHSTAKLFQELESVEMQYESIVKGLPNDCSEINSSDNGLHMIAPSHQRRPTMVKCIGPWTVIQKREDGSVNFNRSWDEYADGFGSPDGELWIGNEMLHHLTNDNCTKLRIIFQDLQNNSWYADYDQVNIATRSEGYRLDFSGYSGNASNTLEYQNHMKFSAIDKDLDTSKGHCADEYEGGWWFSHCLHANLNGRYNLGLTWYDLSRNEWLAVKSSIMMITKRPECLKQSSESFFDDSGERDTFIDTSGDLTTSTAA